jgi:hypothetical protein
MVRTQLASVYGEGMSDEIANAHLASLKALYFDSKYAYATPQEFANQTTAMLTKLHACPMGT